MSLQATDRAGHPVGAITRVISWVIDAIVVSGVSVLAGLGVSLFVSLVPLAHNLAEVLKPVAAAAFVVWCAVYFAAFWSTTGQTLGARLMQIRIVAPGSRRERVHFIRACVRWVAMNLAMVPLGAGYLPVLVGRRPFPDWVARTLVLDAPQLSWAEARMAHVSGRRAPAGQPPARSAPVAAGAVDGAPTNGRSASPVVPPTPRVP